MTETETYALLHGAGAGDAILELRGGRGLVLPDASQLQESFDPLRFVDLCIALEAAVLHERLFVIGPDPAEAMFYLVLQDPIVNTLYSEGILQFVPRYPSFSNTLKRHSRRWWELNELFIASAKLAEADAAGYVVATKPTDLLRRYGPAQDAVAIEELFAIPLVYSAEFLPVYLAVPDIRAEEQAMQRLRASLAASYHDYRKVLLDMRQVQGGGEVLLMPPVALEVLARAEKLEEIGPILLDIRYKYGRLRSRFREADEVLRRGDVSPIDKMREYARIEKSLNALFTDSERRLSRAGSDRMTIFTSFAKGLNESVNIGKLSDGFDLDDINYTKLVGYLIERLRSVYWKFQSRPLHATKMNYLHTADKEI